MDIKPEQLITNSLREVSWGDRVGRILAASLQAVDPFLAVIRNLRIENDALWVGAHDYPLDHLEHVWLVAAGKAGAPMAAAASQVLGERLNGGIVIVKDGQAAPEDVLPACLEQFEAAHPVPDERGVKATGRILHTLAGAGEHDLVLCLISGGGSALLTAPVEGVSLAALQDLTGALLASGADIEEINTLRKHLDQVKGGGLAQMASPARVAALILSDVIGSPLDAIASGPTVPDPSTYTQALAIIERYQLRSSTPPAIIERLTRGAAGAITDTPKPGDPIFNRVHNTIIAENLTAARAGLAKAQEEGFRTMLLTTYLSGEARHIGRGLASIARQVRLTGDPISPPACLVAGGETTVTIRGKGLGGRNQEVALGAVELLGGLEDTLLVALATDGGDGPTDAAGAVVSGSSLERAGRLRLSPHQYLANNDAYHFFEQLGDLLLPGPTNTNVNDLTFLFIH